MAQALYCTSADLLLPSQALSELQPSDIQSAIIKASSEADSYISVVIPLPLRPPIDPDTSLPVYPPALVNAVAQMATYRAMLMRGYAPMPGQNDSIQQGYKDAKAFLKDVSTADAVLQVQGSNDNPEVQAGTSASSAPYRLQPTSTQGEVYDEQEEFWHDRGSVAGGSATGFRGNGDRGY